MLAMRRGKAVKKKKISFIVVVVLVLVFLKVAMLFGEQKSSISGAFIIKLDQKGDFPNPKEGTVIINQKVFMDRIISQEKKVPKYIVLMESETVPGLALRYNVGDSVLEGGLPIMTSEEVIFLDGNTHEIVYTFKTGAEQRLYFDKEEVALARFYPSKIGIIGFAVSDLGSYEVETIDVGGSMEFLDEAR